MLLLNHFTFLCFNCFCLYMYLFSLRATICNKIIVIVIVSVAASRSWPEFHSSIITFAKEAMFRFLCVFLLAGLRRNYTTEFYKIHSKGQAWAKEETVRFLWLSRPRYVRLRLGYGYTWGQNKLRRIESFSASPLWYTRPHPT